MRGGARALHQAAGSRSKAHAGDMPIDARCRKASPNAGLTLFDAHTCLNDRDLRMVGFSVAVVQLGGASVIDKMVAALLAAPVPSTTVIVTLPTWEGSGSCGLARRLRAQEHPPAHQSSRC